MCAGSLKRGDLFFIPVRWVWEMGSYFFVLVWRFEDVETHLLFWILIAIWQFGKRVLLCCVGDDLKERPCFFAFAIFPLGWFKKGLFSIFVSEPCNCGVFLLKKGDLFFYPVGDGLKRSVLFGFVLYWSLEKRVLFFCIYPQGAIKGGLFFVPVISLLIFLHRLRL